MGAEKSCLHLQRDGLLYAASHAQHLQLALGGQAIAALYLDGSGSFGYYLVDACHCLAVEFLLGGGGKKVGGVQYSATAPCNFLIAQTVDFVEKLAGALACIYYMCVRVAE